MSDLSDCIPADELLRGHRCPRLVYLSYQRSLAQWHEPEETLSTLRQHRQQWREQVWQEQGFVPSSQWRPHDRVIPGVLQAGGLCSDCDGLVWNGAWYEPVEIRTAKTIKLDYELRLGILARILGELQGIAPGQGWVIRGDGRWQGVSLWRRQNQIQRLLEQWQTLRHAQALPAVAMSKQRCYGCGWEQYCRQHGDPLSMLPGLHQPHYQALLSAGITSLEALVHLNSEHLQGILACSESQAQRILAQAQACWQQQPLWIKPIQMPSAPLTLYFDVEAHAQGVCVLGVLAVNRQQRSHFWGLWAKDPSHERSLWFRFLELVCRYPTAPIYHFSRFEVQTCQRLSHTYGIPGYSLPQLLARFYDLETLIKGAVYFPIASYSLKNLAGWLGFQWRPVELQGTPALGNGLQAISWYERWLETRDPQYIRALLIYNEDDCRATHHLHHWLVTQSINQPAVGLLHHP